MKKIILLLAVFFSLLLNSCERQEKIVQQTEKPFKSDHIISDEFDAWKVRHVFDKDSLIYRYSDARTMIKLSVGEEFPFQFVNPNDPPNDSVYFGMPGYIDKVVLIIDGKVYEETQSGLHGFSGVASTTLLQAVAFTKNDIKITFYSADDVFTGTINPTGAGEAFKWIRAIK